VHTFNELFYNTLWTVVVQYCSGQERSEAIYHAKLSRWKQLLNTYSSGDVSAIRLLCRECYVVATEFNLLTASSSASCRIVSPPSNLVCRQESTMWLMVWAHHTNSSVTVSAPACTERLAGTLACGEAVQQVCHYYYLIHWRKILTLDIHQETKRMTPWHSRFMILIRFLFLFGYFA